MVRIRGVKAVIALGALVGSLATAPIAGAAVSDAWITAKAKIALATTDGVHATAVNVDTMDGHVTLHGTIPTKAEKARAEGEVRKVSGVKDVRNLLQIVPAAEKKSVDATDAQTKDRVADAIKNDPSLKSSSISVQSVNDGVVLLSGSASSVSSHLRALEVARAVPGVRRVASEVQSPDRLADDEIRHEREPAEAGARRDIGDTTSDMYITSASKLRLLADGRTPALDVNVDTRDGVVTLFGIVPTEEAKRAAEEDVRKVSGVQRVMNALQVVPSARKKQVEARDGDLQKSIEANLAKRDDLRGASIDVDVKNGVARLTGSVPSEEDRLVAAISTRATAGVRAVEDDLRVTGKPAKD